MTIDILKGLLILTLLSVVGILVTGIITFMYGGISNRRNSLKLMNIRVMTQGIALLLLAIILLLQPI